MNICKQIENNGESFWCQHGNDECVGNMIQSCGLYALAGYPIRKTNFIACQMGLDADRTGQTVGIMYLLIITLIRYLKMYFTTVRRR